MGQEEELERLRRRNAYLEERIFLIKTYAAAGDWAMVLSSVEKTEEPKDFNPNLLRRIDELYFSVRMENYFKKVGIEFVWQLVECSPEQFLKLRYFGKKALQEVVDVLTKYDLTLDMRVKHLFEKHHPQ